MLIRKQSKNTKNVVRKIVIGEITGCKIVVVQSESKLLTSLKVSPMPIVPVNIPRGIAIKARKKPS